MVGVQQGDEVGEVEVAQHHVVDAFGLDARMGAGELYLADFLEHLLVLLVEDVFVEQEGYHGVGKAVPHVYRQRVGDETPYHETAGCESRDTTLYAGRADALEEVYLVAGVEQVEETALVVVVAHAALKHTVDIVVGARLIPRVDVVVIL